MRKRCANLPTADRIQTVILLCAAALWLWSGTATWTDLIGRPRDAPFLMIPGHIRSIFFWVLPALFAVVAGVTRKNAPHAFFFLAIGSTVRLVSYLISWVSSWTWVDPFINDSDLKGDPKAWGSGWIYATLILSLIGFNYTLRIIRDLDRTVMLLRIEVATLRAEKGA